MFKSEKTAMAVLTGKVKMEQVVTPRRPEPKATAAKRPTPRKVSISVTASEGLAVCLGLPRGWIVELSGRGAKRTRRFRSPGGRLVESLEEALRYAQTGSEPTEAASQEPSQQSPVAEKAQEAPAAKPKKQQQQRPRRQAVQQGQTKRKHLDETPGLKAEISNFDPSSHPEPNSARRKVLKKEQQDELMEKEEEKEEEKDGDEKEEGGDEDACDGGEEGESREEGAGSGEGECEGEEERDQKQSQTPTQQGADTQDEGEAEGEEEAEQEEEEEEETEEQIVKTEKRASATNTSRTKRELVKKERVKAEPRVKAEKILDANGEMKVMPVAKSRQAKPGSAVVKLGRPTLAEQEQCASEQAIGVDPNAVVAGREELSQQAQELLPLLREQGFGAAPRLLGVSGSSFSRMLSTQLRGLFVRTPKPVGGRECYQKVRLAGGSVSRGDIYIVWSAKLARWQIVDRLRKALTNAFARSPVDYRRPALEKLEGTWLVQLDGYWYEDGQCQLFDLSLSDSQAAGGA